mgnify:FL=1
MLENVIKTGGKESRKPQDHGWMYGRSFEDLDGHIWEIIYMDEKALKENHGQEQGKSSQQSVKKQGHGNLNIICYHLIVGTIFSRSYESMYIPNLDIY